MIPLTWFDVWFYGMLADIGAVPIRIPEIFYTVQNLWEMTLVISAIYIGKRLATKVHLSTHESEPVAPTKPLFSV